MAEIPYMQPMDVSSKYTNLGQSVLRLGRNVSMTLDEYQKEKNDASTINTWIDALKKVGINEQRMPGESVLEFKERAAGKWLVYQTISDWKTKDPSILSVDPNTATQGILNVEQAKTRAKALDEQFQKKYLSGTEQKGISAASKLPPKATQAERAQEYSKATGGEQPGKLGELAITGGEKPITPWQSATFGANQEDRAVQQIQAAVNSLVGIKQKKQNVWNDYAAAKQKIESDLMLTDKEKHDKITALEQKAHADDEAYDNESKLNAVTIYSNLKDFPHLARYVPEDEIAEYEKYLKLASKKPKRGITPPPAPGGSTGGTDKFIVGKKYKDASGKVATYLGNGQWSE